MTIADRALPTTQHRQFEFTDFEFRDDGPTGFTFEGVAAVVDVPYEVRDSYGTFMETIRPGAFNKTLRDGKADVALFVNHDYSALPLATRLDGSLKLSADPHLRVVAQLNPARPSVQEVRHAVLDGQARQMSIGFNPVKARDVWADDFSSVSRGEVMLGETSIVWRGASPTTTGAMRSYADLMRSLTDVDMSKDEMRRLMRTMQTRFADLFDNMIESRLLDEVKELLALGPDCYVYIVDHTDNVVIYCVYANGCDDMYQLGYTADADGNITLSTDAPIIVQPVTSYVPEPPEPGERSALHSIEQRDRDDLARLEMLRLDSPALLLI